MRRGRVTTPVLAAPFTGIVELLGPAGSGKSTLLQQLRETAPWAVRAPGLWGLPRAQLAARAAALTPVAAQAALALTPLGAGEWAQMARTEVLLAALARDEATDGRLHVVDEGPLFALAWMSVFHGDRGLARRRWRARTIAACAPLLRAVVRVDADDDDLAQRIRARTKPHMVKQSSDAAIREFTTRFRAAFELVLQELKAEATVPVIALRTDRSPSDLVDAMAIALLEAPDVS